jgi:hypothetical protein
MAPVVSLIENIGLSGNRPDRPVSEVSEVSDPLLQTFYPINDPKSSQDAQAREREKGPQ